MNKSEFVTAISGKLNSTKAEAARAVEAVLDVIKETLRNGDSLRLVGFGTYKVVNVAEKEVRNPQNGQKIKVKASKRPRFIPGKGLKSALNTKAR